MWSSTNPRVYREVSLHSLKLGEWCVLSHRQIIGPIFFNSTIPAETYRRIITDFITLLKCSEVNAWFKQGNACPHATRETMQFL